MTTRALNARRDGFTLIELVVVMAIIGLLLTLALPRYFHSIERGKAQVQQQNLAVIRDAIDKYYGDNGQYPDKLDDLVVKRYLRSIPVDPVNGSTAWTIVAPPTDTAKTGGIYDVAPAEREASAPAAASEPVASK
ncbi:type II secretion system protein [uncultured Ralstonia sp.]|jgi:general secretion pathway protein G|uniref:type II secretion system protein n=1 Tax=Ralstonia sp. TaxID=54061 RepID=UPI001EA88204|nr:prepilin-type N-terminal cleavage/methylation domain-containing protein [uncultured Ralstonia sp.]UCF24267.1 MAG: prepilin-type N-terminal cleavage/methylation domain-containing protein [Ralstonia sp.]